MGIRGQNGLSGAKTPGGGVFASLLVNKIFILLTNLYDRFCSLFSSFGTIFIKPPWAGQTEENAKGVMIVSLILCTCPCVYQQDGVCTLVRAVSLGGGPGGCVNCVPTTAPKSQQRGQGLPDVGHLDEFQALRDL